MELTLLRNYSNFKTFVVFILLFFYAVAHLGGE